LHTHVNASQFTRYDASLLPGDQANAL
jgi:hypothetical protein